MSAIALGQIHVAFQARGQEIRDGTSGKVKPRKAFWALRGFVKWKFGGSCGDRTCDSLLKRQILYLLS